MDAEKLKHWMKQRMARELGVPVQEVDFTASFKAMGLDSMTLIGMTGELAEVVGNELPVEMLWEHETIDALSGALARLITEFPTAAGQQTAEAVPTENLYLASATKLSPIEAIQPHGRQRPLFLVHELTNLVVEYRLLTQYLGDDQPVFALKAQGDRHATLEKMAASYIDGIRTVQRRGPYRLGGYCFGAVVAFEIARQLQAAGEEIEFLGLIDAVLPNRPPTTRFQDITRAAMWAGNLLRFPFFVAQQARKNWPELLRRASQIRRHRAKYFGSLRLIVGKARAALGLPSPTLDEWVQKNFFAAHVEMVQANLGLLNAYRSGAYEGRVILFLSSAPTFSRAGAAWQWRSLTQGVDVVYVEGMHGHMLKAPEVVSLAEGMRPFLESAKV